MSLNIFPNGTYHHFQASSATAGCWVLLPSSLREKTLSSRSWWPGTSASRAFIRCGFARTAAGPLSCSTTCSLATKETTWYTHRYRISFKGLPIPWWMLCLLNSCYISRMLIKYAVDQCIPHLKWHVEYKSYDEGYICYLPNQIFFNLQLISIETVMVMDWEVTLGHGFLAQQLQSENCQVVSSNPAGCWAFFVFDLLSRC